MYLHCQRNFWEKQRFLPKKHTILKINAKNAQKNQQKALCVCLARIKKTDTVFAVPDKFFVLQIALLEICKRVVKASVFEGPARRIAAAFLRAAPLVCQV